MLITVLGRECAGMKKLEDVILSSLRLDDEEKESLLKAALLWEEIGPNNTFPLSLRNGVLKVEAKGYPAYFSLASSSKHLVESLREKGIKVHRIVPVYSPDPPPTVDKLEKSWKKEYQELLQELKEIVRNDPELSENLGELLSELKPFITMIAKARAKEGNYCKFCGRPSKRTPCQSCAMKIEEIKMEKVKSFLERKPWGSFQDLSNSTLSSLMSSRDTESSDVSLSDVSPLELEAILTLSEEDFDKARRELIESLERRIRELRADLLRKKQKDLKEVLPLVVRYLKLTTRSERIPPETINRFLKALGFK